MAVIVTQTNHEDVGGKRGHKKLESNPTIITSSANKNYSVITGQIAGHKYAPSCSKKTAALTHKLLQDENSTSNSTGRPHQNTSYVSTANIMKREKISLNITITGTVPTSKMYHPTISKDCCFVSSTFHITKMLFC
jgi:hypothetical protein